MKFTQKFHDAVSDLLALLESSPVKESLVVVHEHFKLDGEVPETGIKVILNSPDFSKLLSDLEFRGLKIFVEVQKGDKIKTLESTYYAQASTDLQKVNVFDQSSKIEDKSPQDKSPEGWLDAHCECW